MTHRSHDAKVSPAATQRPKEFRLMPGVRKHDTSICENHLGGQQIVATIPPEMSSIGDQAKVVFDPEHTHVYVDDIRITGAAA